MKDLKMMHKLMGMGLAFATLGFTTADADDGTTVIETSSGTITVYHDAISDTRDVTYYTTEVNTAPPEPLKETEYLAARPNDDAVWIPGYWYWNSNTGEYEWINGVWRRPIPNNTWHEGEWVNVGDSYVWHAGYWGPESQSEPIYAETAPPARRDEDPEKAPGVVWVPGEWKYEDGQYVWVEGSWQQPLDHDMTWVTGAWVNTVSGYRYIPGHWDYTDDTRTYVNVTK